MGKALTLKGLLLLFAGLLLGVFLGAIVLFSGPTAGMRASNENYFPPDPGSEVKNFQLENISGSTVSLNDLKGKPVVINFWATWCGPCTIEMPLLEKYAREYPEEVVILGVNSAEEKDVVEKFINDQEITFPILLDRDGSVSDLYLVRNFPVTFFIDKEGVLRAQHTGLLSETLIDQYLQQIGVQP